MTGTSRKCGRIQNDEARSRMEREDGKMGRVGGRASGDRLSAFPLWRVTASAGDGREHLRGDGLAGEALVGEDGVEEGRLEPALFERDRQHAGHHLVLQEDLADDRMQPAREEVVLDRNEKLRLL